MDYSRKIGALIIRQMQSTLFILIKMLLEICGIKGLWAARMKLLNMKVVVRRGA